MLCSEFYGFWKREVYRLNKNSFCLLLRWPILDKLRTILFDISLLNIDNMGSLDLTANPASCDIGYINNFLPLSAITGEHSLYLSTTCLSVNI